ncbi:hypothetical protein EV699_13310 [Plasticicumulans lactativorans]|uniref:DUF465 domain-containing protein n=1 Tax=Plasticicumulans lactativorans TaxID=1133106 RepID=A0A4R2KY70_9GAMM|nr:DUF465 domain-containing protein [Plasticicumulans lactativorans]TCO76329.1 hypothetical protein EV699_13310 [Plasticicumulans lactativorans]
MKTEQEIEALRLRLAAFRLEHRDLDDAIAHLLERPYVDQMQLTRMKKRKLALKDAITRIEDQLIPDIIA